jgi:DNA repair protein RadC
MDDFKRIKDWVLEERPREKMQKQGRASLTNSELLAILISTGTAKKSALDIAREILHKTDNDLMTLSKWSFSDFCKIDGIGEAKAITIMAALELAGRKNNSTVKQKSSITCSQDAYKLMKHRLEDLNYEEFWVLTLNRKNSIINEYKISEGGITATVVDQRKIFKLALDDKSTGILLFHNHPSGNRNPSESDNQLTKKLKEGGKLLDIAVMDHIIIVQSDYFSYADEGVL